MVRAGELSSYLRWSPNGCWVPCEQYQTGPVFLPLFPMAPFGLQPIDGLRGKGRSLPLAALPAESSACGLSLLVLHGCLDLLHGGFEAELLLQDGDLRPAFARPLVVADLAEHTADRRDTVGFG